MLLIAETLILLLMSGLCIGLALGYWLGRISCDDQGWPFE